MSNTPQTEAQRLAYLLEDNASNANITSCDQEREIAAELRRLNAENQQLRAQLAKAVAEEREACAKVCDDRYMGDNNREDMEAKRCAAAIRARSNT